MSLEDALDLLGKSKTRLDQFGVKSLAIFGSTARHEATATSDIDILVIFKLPPNFDQYIETKFFLEELLGCRVDLVTHDGLKPMVRTEVDKEAIYVA
jgi:uncharacterized protein